MTAPAGVWAIYLALAMLAALAVTAVVRRRAASRIRCALYVIRSTGPRPLRIGITCNPARRFRQYARTAPWWPMRVGDPHVRWYPDRAAALRAERQAIGQQAPLYNHQHNLGRGHHVARPLERDHLPQRRHRAGSRRPLDGRRVRPAPAGQAPPAGGVAGYPDRGSRLRHPG